MVNRTGSHTLQMAPRVGFEPTTLRLTAGCSAVELPRNTVRLSAQVRIIPEPSHCARPNFKEFRRLCNSAPFGHRLSIRADEAEAPGALPSPLPRTGSERANTDPTEGRRASTDPANRRPANGKGVSWMVLTEIRLRSSPARESRRKGRKATREYSGSRPRRHPTARRQRRISVKTRQRTRAECRRRARKAGDQHGCQASWQDARRSALRAEQGRSNAKGRRGQRQEGRDPPITSGPCNMAQVRRLRAGLHPSGTTRGSFRKRRRSNPTAPEGKAPPARAQVAHPSFARKTKRRKALSTPSPWPRAPRRASRSRSRWRGGCPRAARPRCSRGRLPRRVGARG